MLIIGNSIADNTKNNTMKVSPAVLDVLVSLAAKALSKVLHQHRAGASVLCRDYLDDLKATLNLVDNTNEDADEEAVKTVNEDVDSGR